MDLLGYPGGGTQSRGALARSLTDKISFLWRDLNLKNEQRTSDLEWKARRVQERGLPIPGQMWEAAPKGDQRQGGSWKAGRSAVLGLRE